MIGSWTQLLTVVALVLSPFLIYGTYLVMRGGSRPTPVARQKASVTQRSRTEPTLGGAAEAGAPDEIPGGEPALGQAPQPDFDAQGEGPADAGEQGGRPGPEDGDSVSEGPGEEGAAPEAAAPPAAGKTANGAAGPAEGLDSLGLPEGDAPAVPGAAAAHPPEEDGFPHVDDELPEPLYYMVRMAVKGGIDVPDVHQLSSDLVSKTRLRMYQTMLCYDRDKGRWESPRPEKRYSELVWAVPMCNRTTHLSPEDISGIVKVIQNTMRKVGGQAEFPPHNDLDERRSGVDAFCEHVDHRVTAHLKALSSSGGKPRRGGDIIDLALSSGGMELIDSELRRVVNGETWFVLKDGGNKDLSSHSPDRMVAGLAATLDFPHVSSPLKAFDEMFEFAGMLSRVLGFSLVDEDNNPIDEGQVAETREHLESIADYMRESRVPPGSKVARALFS